MSNFIHPSQRGRLRIVKGDYRGMEVPTIPVDIEVPPTECFCHFTIPMMGMECVVCVPEDKKVVR